MQKTHGNKLFLEFLTRMPMTRSLLVFLLASFFVGANASSLRAQYGKGNIFAKDTVELKLVGTAGLRSEIRVVEDSGKPAYRSFTTFSPDGDSIWERSQYHDNLDSGSTLILFDSANHVLFMSDNNSFLKQRITYYYWYDSLKRLVKESSLSPLDNRFSITCYSYRAQGDSVLSYEYDQDGNIFSTQLNTYDSKGNLLYWSGKNSNFPEFEYARNTYDAHGRLIEQMPMYRQKEMMSLTNSFREKRVYADSQGIENGWKYKWADTSWSNLPIEHWRMDSISHQRIVESFNPDGSIKERTLTDYDTLFRVVHSQLEDPKTNYTRSGDSVYGPNGLPTSHIVLHNGRVVETETYTYIYSK
jgi:hypothetical protein